MAQIDALVIGAGPAGLMAAQIMGQAGLHVTICDAKPSVARKFLMAGKSGLNLTKDQPLDDFLQHYDCPAQMRPMVHAFGPRDVQGWANGLGQDTFVGSTGRVFPRVMKASPLLRAWLQRLDSMGVVIKTKHRWLGMQGNNHQFDTSTGMVALCPTVTILALGGGSWARLGSDGAWVPTLNAWGVKTTPFLPMNMGFNRGWSHHMAPHLGQPVKNIALMAGGRRVRGEFVITQNGVEGGAIYALSDTIRDGASLAIDFLPTTPMDQVQNKLAKARRGDTLATTLAKQFKLTGAKRALFFELHKAAGQGDVAQTLKHAALPLNGPRPLDQAISTAGGVAFSQVTDDLMLHTHPGVFCAGEMLDWSAPTGGYLLTACLATGVWAGQGAVRYVASATKSITR